MAEMPTRKDFKNHIGEIHGQWTVIAYFGKFGFNHCWLCRCSCGMEKPVQWCGLLCGYSKSCGCNGDVATGRAVQGRSQMPEYTSWRGMVARCCNAKSPHFAYYGGRGIVVCGEWRTSFAQFLADMGTCPPGMTIERNDPNGNYCKENCRWATMHEQSRNKSNNVTLTHDGVTLCATDWAARLGVHRNTIYYRLRHGLNWVTGSR